MCVILPISVLTSTRVFSLSGCQYLIPTHIALAAAPNPDPAHGNIGQTFKKSNYIGLNTGLTVRPPPAFFIEGCMPGEQEVVRFEVDTALNCGRIGGPALERHHGFNIETHQLPVQVLQAPVIYAHNY